MQRKEMDIENARIIYNIIKQRKDTDEEDEKDKD